MQLGGKEIETKATRHSRSSGRPQGSPNVARSVRPSTAAHATPEDEARTQPVGTGLEPAQRMLPPKGRPDLSRIGFGSAAVQFAPDGTKRSQPEEPSTEAQCRT